MKTKTYLILTSFILALTISLAFVALSKNKTFNQFFQKNDPQAKEKIYTFLLKDKEIISEMLEKTDQVQMDKRLKLWIDYKEQRFKLNTTDLPEDFRNAWEKKILSDIDWLNFFYYFRLNNPEQVGKTQAQKELFAQKDAQYQSYCVEFDKVVRSYGIEYDAKGRLIENK